MCQYSFGDIARRHADYPAAIQFFAEALRLVRIVGDPVNIARFSFAIGDTQLRNGQVDQALPRLLESLSIYRQKGEGWGVAYSLIDLACAAVTNTGKSFEKTASQAASMLGAASALLESEPEYYQDYAHEFFPPAEKEVRARLADADFTEAWQAGRKSPDTVLKSLEN